MLIFLNIGLMVLNLFFGSVSIGLPEIMASFLQPVTVSTASYHIILHIRLPQILTALITGAALSVSGLQMQTLFRNPLAGPTVLGISSGAGLGVAVLLMALPTQWLLASWLQDAGIAFAAFGGAMLVLGVVLFFSRFVTQSTVLLIIGIMIGYAVSALTNVLQAYSQLPALKAFVLWGLGSFAEVPLSGIGWYGGVILLVLLMSFGLAKSMNMYLLGDQYARNLGLNLRLIRLLLILLSGFLVAVTTANTGPIAFIGLAVPHIVRNVFQSSDHFILLPAAALAGSAFALLCNFIARLPGFDGVLPINTVTAIIGAPIVIWVLLKQRKQHT
jgi:iron complex transport system permease protein